MPLRSQKGVSTITIVLIAAVALLWILALCTVIVPSYKEISRARQLATLRMDLESSLNWAVDQLSTDNSPIDDKTADGIPAEFEVPQDVVTAGSHVTISVNNKPPAAGSGMYVESLDSSIRSNNIPENGWRIVTASGARSGVKKSMRAALMPAYGNGKGATVALFDYALFSTDDVTVDDGTTITVLGNQSANAAVLASNSTLTISKNNNIAGSVRVASSPMGDSRTVLNIDRGATIHGTAQANGGINLDRTARVLNDMHDPAGAVQERLSLSPRDTPPVLSPPPNSTNLGTFKVDAGQSVKLPAGNYVVNKFEMGMGAELSVTGTSSMPVNIFIKNANNGIVIDMANNARVNVAGKSSDLRIWYPGNAQINMGKSSVFNGVVAAPGSRIQVGMNSYVRGALIGNRVHIKKDSVIIFDASLKSAPGDLTYNLGPKPIDHRQAVSWQELDEDN
jgi:hypothetical protein